MSASSSCRTQRRRQARYASSWKRRSVVKTMRRPPASSVATPNSVSPRAMMPSGLPVNTLTLADEGLRRETAFEQARRVHALRPGLESVSGSAPAELVDVLEQRRIAHQRGQALEQQRLFEPLAEDLGRERLDRSVPVQQAGCAHRADAGHARISIGRITDQREKVRNQRRFDA